MLNSNKVKVKILKIYNMIYDDYYSINQSIMYPATLDWEEIDEEQLTEVKNAIASANAMMQNNDFTYVLISYNENMKDEVFNLASEFRRKIEREEEQRKQKALEAKKKREKKALERKRKQLEKLKEELGENL